MINRRQFLQAGAAATAALAFPFRAYPFSQSLTIQKFEATLPGLDPAGANNHGNYIPVLVPDRMTMPGTDLYHIVTKPFSQPLLPNIQTKLWGYADADVNKQDLKYLGGVIIATKGVPVRFVVENQLPPAHILPVDPTLVDAAEMAVATGGRTDIIAIHLHGGLVFWTSDGGPFAWFSNPDHPDGFVHGPSFLNSATNPPTGGAIYDYPNGQSARTIWYHDHAYSLTRTNVFAGLASAYLITDDDEQGLIASGVLPGTMPEPVTLGGASYPLGIPLIIQDKTFWDPTKGDANYPMAVPPQQGAPIQAGDLWYPHVYEGGADPDGLPSMTLSAPTPGITARWGALPVPPAMDVVQEQFPPISTVPEYFSDTILVNGAPYPRVTVPPRKLRFRFLNGSNARFYNLQLYVAIDGQPDGIRLVNTGDLDPNDNPVMAPANRPGPAFIQIANEAGFLPQPVLFSADGSNKNSNRVMGYKLGSDLSALRGRRADSSIERTVAGQRVRLNLAVDPTIGNADRYNLLLAPAERPDVIIDFRDFAGQTLILYNDAPAPFPGGDIRNDYYVGAPNLTSIGGVAGTDPGFGPDTRIIMRFDVTTTGGVTEDNFAVTLAKLGTELDRVFKLRPDPMLPFLDPGSHIGKSLLEDNEENPEPTFGRLRQLLGNGAGEASTLLDTPIDIATEGEVQFWDIYNLTADTHPMHFHLVNVNVIGRQQWEFDDTGAPVVDQTTMNIAIIPNTFRPPDPNELGWKETVRMNPGEVTTVAMKFDLPPGTRPDPSPRFAGTEFAGAAEYVWHCHILEHEEHDMMHPLLVLPGGTPLPAGFRAVRRQ